MEKSIVYATASDSCATLQSICDAAMVAKWRNETRKEHPTAIGGVNLGGTAIYELAKENSNA